MISEYDNYKPSETNADIDNAGVKAVITIAIIATAFVTSLLFARLCQYCRRKNLLPDDDESDISEHTRHVITSRLAVLQFKKSEMRKERRLAALRAFRKWLSKIRKKKKPTVDWENPENDSPTLECAKENGGFVHGTSDAVIVGDGSATPRMTRLPVFDKQPAKAEVHRTVLPQIVPNETSPAPRGRPISSKARVLPTKTVTTAEINTKSKPVGKTVQFNTASPNTTASSKPDVTSHTNGSVTKVVVNGDVQVSADTVT